MNVADARQWYNIAIQDGRKKSLICLY